MENSLNGEIWGMFNVYNENYCKSDKGGPFFLVHQKFPHNVLERQFVKGKGSHFLKGLIFMTVGGHDSCYKVIIMCMVALAW